MIGGLNGRQIQALIIRSKIFPIPDAPRAQNSRLVKTQKRVGSATGRPIVSITEWRDKTISAFFAGARLPSIVD